MRGRAPRHPAQADPRCAVRCVRCRYAWACPPAEAGGRALALRGEPAGGCLARPAGRLSIPHACPRRGRGLSSAGQPSWPARDIPRRASRAAAASRPALCRATPTQRHRLFGDDAPGPAPRRNFAPRRRRWVGAAAPPAECRAGGKSTTGSGSRQRQPSTDQQPAGAAGRKASQ